MFLKQLEISDFRNYVKTKFELSPHVNIFLGDNAQGKTNLLEAIYFLGTTKSHRCSNQGDIIKVNKKTAIIHGVLDIESNQKELFIGFEKDKKNLKIDNKTVKKIRDYISIMNLIIFCPDDLDIIKGNPEVRRRYLNIALSQISISYAKVLEEYNKLLKMRNDYLSNTHQRFDDTYFEILTKHLIVRAINIYKYRKNYIDKVNKIVPDIFESIAGFSEFFIQYVPSLGGDYNSSKIEEMLLKKYSQIKHEERLAGKTLLGPHRDDFEFILNNSNLKMYGSQGQQRISVISLKLAEIILIKDIKKTTPIILLDDVFSELDDKKKNRLLKYIDSDVQVIITTTDLNNIQNNLLKNAKIMKISNGNLEEVKEDGTK